MDQPKSAVHGPERPLRTPETRGGVPGVMRDSPICRVGEGSAHPTIAARNRWDAEDLIPPYVGEPVLLAAAGARATCYEYHHNTRDLTSRQMLCI